MTDLDETGESRTVARRPWLAVVLSLLLPGLGHVYSGALRRGLITWTLVMIAGTVAFALLMILPAWAQLPVLALIVFAIPIVAALDAFRTARRQNPGFRLRAYNRWYVYVVIFLAMAFVIHPSIVMPVFESVGKAYRLPSSSMEPTLLPGHYLLVTRLHGSIERGQIMTYRAGEKSFVKRVVGVPGDTLAMQNGELTVNGERLAEPYARRAAQDRLDPQFAWQRGYLARLMDTSTYVPSLKSWGPILLPPKKYFVLGDNRSESLDSRYTGFVSESDLVARATVIYFSRGQAGGVRWNRIGLSPQ
jgi:signal peptidase I